MSKLHARSTESHEVSSTPRRDGVEVPKLVAKHEVRGDTKPNNDDDNTDEEE